MRTPPRLSAALAGLATSLAGLGLLACATTPTPRPSVDAPSPPVAAKKPHVTEIHGERLVDDYYWLRERESPEVLAYLEAENAYTEAMLAPTKGLQDALYEEMLARIKEDDTSVPYRKDEYWYYSRTETGKPYKIHCRKKGSLDASEEVLLDENLAAEGHEYFRLGNAAVSPDHRWLAWAADYDGGERHVLRFRELATGEDRAEEVTGTYYGLVWANDSKTVFYTTVDAAMRPYRVHRHQVGTDPAKDAIVHQEDDEAYFVGLRRARSEGYLYITLDSAVTSEVRYLPAGEPAGEFRVFSPRRQGIEYSVEHHGERFFVVTNDGALNFKLMETPVSSTDAARWKEVIPHREATQLVAVAAFAKHLVVVEREAGLPQLRVRPLSGDADEFLIDLEEPTYEVWLEDNHEFETSVLRYGFSSLVTPESVYDHDLVARTRELRKRKEVIGYQRDLYTSDRIWASAPDGTKVPISLVYRKDTPLDGSAPMMLNGYGSYGASYDPWFSSNWVSLLDRGFVVGIAHIRGGGELGRAWKDAGKFEKKVNTFTDFIACAEHLVAEKYTSAERLGISGWSAGGLLIGAVLNRRPDLFGAAIAGVPFVDVVNTMLDETIPLTVIEWEEWGNPAEEAPFRWMLAYSPYDNVSAQDYPDLLVLAGLNDPRVQYWEPAKWTAKLRATKTDDGLLVLRTNMGAGHGGASGRYGRLRDRAVEYAFLLWRLGVWSPVSAD